MRFLCGRGQEIQSSGGSSRRRGKSRAPCITRSMLNTSPLLRSEGSEGSKPYFCTFWCLPSAFFTASKAATLNRVTFGSIGVHIQVFARQGLKRGNGKVNFMAKRRVQETDSLNHEPSQPRENRKTRSAAKERREPKNKKHAFVFALFEFFRGHYAALFPESFRGSHIPLLGGNFMVLPPFFCRSIFRWLILYSSSRGRERRSAVASLWRDKKSGNMLLVCS